MIRFLALGDSYTIGEGVAEEQRWPVQLAASLREHGVRIGEPEMIAKTGWTTDELSGAIEKAKPTGGYGLVSLLIGVNNQYRGRSEEEYRTQFRSLLTRAIDFAGNDAGRVIVISIPDWGVTPFAEGRDQQQILREINRFNEINRDETSRSGARYVDITPESRRAGTDPTLIAGDGLHPSGKMYSFWARQALPAAMAALGAGGGAVSTVVDPAPALPRVLFRTSLGDIEVEVDSVRAPITAANFLRYVDAGSHSGGRFYRTVKPDNQPNNAVKIEVIEGGADSTKQAWPPILLERTSVTGLAHLNGTVSMGRDGPDTATSEFFICIGDQPELDFGGNRNNDGQGFGAFGRVLHGMDVVKRIQLAAADGQRLTPPIQIISTARITQ